MTTTTEIHESSSSKESSSTGSFSSQYGPSLSGSFSSQCGPSLSGSPYSSPNGIKYDRYGFELKELPEMSPRLSQIEQKQRSKEAQREKKWLKMLRDWNGYLVKNPKKVLTRLRKGVPDKLRARVWQLVLDTDSSTVDYGAIYQEYLKQTSPCEAEIERDIRRTFPSHAFFTQYHGYRSLFNVLKAYSIYDTDLGYCQGMGFITGMFLIYMTEEDAFRLLVSLMNDQKIYRIRGLYMPGLPSIELYMYQFNKLLDLHLPQLCKHLREISVELSMFCPQWFIGSFIISFPFPLSLRIWDCFIGSGRVIFFQVALAILKIIQDELLKSTFESAFSLLRDIPLKYLEPDLVMRTSESFSVTYHTLSQMETDLQISKANQQKASAPDS